MALAGGLRGAGKGETAGRRLSRSTWTSIRRTGKTRRRLIHLLLEQESFADAAEHIAILLPAGAAERQAQVDPCRLLPADGPIRGGADPVCRPAQRRRRTRAELMKAAVYCLDRMGARAVGARALESFMKQHGETLSLLLMLGVLQYQAGSLEKSAETFRKAVSLLPGTGEPTGTSGMVYRKMGNDTFRREVPRKGGGIPLRGRRTAKDPPKRAARGAARRP